MAVNSIFGCQAACRNIIRFDSNINSLPILSSYPMKQISTMQVHLGFIKKPIRRHLVIRSSSPADDLNIHSDPTMDESTSIEKFYSFVNDKRLDKIHDQIAENCYFEECSFPQALQGRKEVMEFFTKLVEGMGHNVKFKIENIVSKGDDADNKTAAVLWHLEWNQEEIPFTRGCSYYEFSQDQQQHGLMIKKARIVIESPIKPGAIVLILLKNVTRLFDENPNATLWLLRRPHVIANFIVKVYSKIFAPIINPLISGYITMWRFMARIVGFIFSLLLLITKFLPSNL
ncbi:hypothetical protein ACFE04_013936 [Oxalis oulophora]